MRIKEAMKAWLTRAAIGQMRASWPQKSFLRRFLTNRNVDCVLDVGANSGQFGSELRVIGYRGLIVSFEPDPDVFIQLQARAANDPRWICKNLALGAEQGALQLNRMARSEFNSFFKPTTE